MTRKVNTSFVKGNSIRLLLVILLLDLKQDAETFLSTIVLADFSKKKIQLSKLKNGCKIKYQTKKLFL